MIEIYILKFHEILLAGRLAHNLAIILNYDSALNNIKLFKANIIHENFVSSHEKTTEATMESRRTVFVDTILSMGPCDPNKERAINLSCAVFQLSYIHHTCVHLIIVLAIKHKSINISLPNNDEKSSALDSQNHATAVPK